MASYIGYLRKHDSAGYRIEFPDFPECDSTAQRLEHVGVMGAEDLLRHVAALVSFGLPVPPPTSMAQLADDPRREGCDMVVVELDLDLVANPTVSRYHNL